MITRLDYFELHRKMLLELSGSEMKVFMCLLFLHKNKKHTYAFPSQETISQETALSTRTVASAVKSLDKKKWIKIGKQECSGYDVFHKNTYEILVVAEYKPEATKEESVVNGLDDLDCSLEEETKDTTRAKRLIEGKLNLTLTKWQTYITKKMDMQYLVKAVNTYIKKKGRTFSFLIQLYTDLLCKYNIFTKDLAELFKVEWTGNKADYEQRIAEIESRDEYDDILYSIYTKEEVEALRSSATPVVSEVASEKEPVNKVSDTEFSSACAKLGISF